MDLTGQRLGPYLLEAPIGGGAYGHVYRAKHIALDVARAVKVMQSEVAGDPRFRDRFLREARTAAGLAHPNIVAVYDFGSEGELQYLVMEYVESQTLADYLASIQARQRLTDSTLHTCVRDIAAALDHAHAAGIIHRDLKPANVLIRTRDRRALLTDFGIARARTDVELTGTGIAIGTYAYMSPEQCRGDHELAPASDIYSFGTMLYEMATGAPPFGRGITAAAGHVEKPMPPLRLVDPSLPLGLESVLAKALTKKPGDRYESAGQLAIAYLEVVSKATAEAGDQTRPGAPFSPKRSFGPTPERPAPAPERPGPRWGTPASPPPPKAVPAPQSPPAAPAASTASLETQPQSAPAWSPAPSAGGAGAQRPPAPAWTPPSRPVYEPAPAPAARPPRPVPPPVRTYEPPQPPPRALLIGIGGVLAVIVLAGLVLGAVRLLAHGPTPAPTAETAPPVTAASFPPAVQGHVGSAISVAGARLTVTRVNLDAQPPPALADQTDTRFVTVQVRYQASGSSPVLVSPYDWVLTDSTGAVYGAVADGLSGALPERTLAPGQGASGLVGFQVPVNVQGLSLNFNSQVGDATATVPLS